MSLPRRRTVTIEHAMVIVGVSRRTMHNWIAQKKVEYVRTAGGAVRIFEDTLWKPGESDESLVPLAPVTPVTP